MAVNGALATTVADLAVAHAVLAGEEPGPPPAPDRPLRIARQHPVAGARGARRRRDPGRGRRRRRRCSTAAGHTVVRRDPPITPGAAAGALARWMVGAENDAEHLGLDRAALQPRSRTHARIGPAGRAGRGWSGRGRRSGSASAWSASSTTSTCCSAPVTTGPPLAARPWHERSFLANITANARWAPWTAAWNLAGLPALVLPAGIRPEGLPVAVQFVGPPGAEGRLLWLAGELERRQPWRRYAPVFDPTAATGRGARLSAARRRRAVRSVTRATRRHAG